MQYGAQPRWFLIAHERTADEPDDQVTSLDPLTGLPNKALLRDRLQQAVARARRSKEQFAVLFLDSDRFKAINETQATFCRRSAFGGLHRSAAWIRPRDGYGGALADKFVGLVTTPGCGTPRFWRKKLSDLLRLPIKSKAARDRQHWYILISCRTDEAERLFGTFGWGAVRREARGQKH